MIIRCCTALLLVAAVAQAKPMQAALDSTTVNTFLQHLVDIDTRTDSHVVLNYQNMASKKDPTHDNAHLPLFTTVDDSVLNGPTYVAFAKLLNFYKNTDSETAQVFTNDWQKAIQDFLFAVMSTPVMTATMQFVAQNNLGPSDPSGFKDLLNQLWFQPYARKAVAGSSGFKSVFAGESTGNDITRFNSWLGFYFLEKAGAIDYHGWFTKDNGVVIDLQFALNKIIAVEKSLLLNTSPEFEIAAYSVIALSGTVGTVQIHGNEIDLNAATLNLPNKVIDQCYPGFSQAAKTTKHGGSGTAATKKPVPTNDADLQNLVDNMWTQDTEKPSATDVTINWGSHISGKSGSKNQPLFTKVNEDLFNKKQYSTLITTYTQDLLTPDVCKVEPAMTGFRKQYFQAVFDAFTASPMFQSAFAYLKGLNVRGTTDINSFKTNVLWPLWFGVYSRCKGPLGSSGWEHVFSGEIKGNGVDGQHDWVRYYLQQKQDKMEYEGYYSHDGNLIGTFQYTWMGATKPKGGFFTGTSPAFDFSILTVCALSHGNGGNCHFKLNGNPITVTSYTQACDAGTCLATAYPSDS